MEIENHKSIKPGSWIRIPIIYETKCKTQQKDAYHHAIMICPLLEIGFNATGTIIDKLHITSNNKLYSCDKYEIINKPLNYKECELIIRRALKYYGTRKYSQMFNNCEHFASYCFNNKSESKQVKYTLWNNTSSVHQFFQDRSSWFTNSMLFLNSFNIVSDKMIDKVCESNHKIGKFNGKIIDFCQDKAEENKIENQYDIKKMNDNDENKKNMEIDDNDENDMEMNDVDVEEEQKEEQELQENEDVDVDELQIVKDAKFVRGIIKDNLNNAGKIDKDKIDFIIDQIRPILIKYF